MFQYSNQFCHGFQYIYCSKSLSLYLYLYIYFLHLQSIVSLISSFQYTIDMDLKQFSFTKALKTAAQSSRWDDTITSSNKTTKHQPALIQRKSDLSYFQLRHQLWSTLQFLKHIYYFFTTVNNTNSNSNSKSSKDKQFILTLYTFAIEDGKHSILQLKGLKGTPSCLSAGIGAYLKQSHMIVQTKQAQNNYIYKTVVLVGLQEGFVKIIQLDTDKNNCIKHSLYSYKLEQKPLVSITFPEKIHYQQKNICFILLEDSKVFVFNYVSRLIICIYQPPILSHDHGVSFALHPSARYFATSTHSGQITIWQLNESALKAIAQSEERQSKPRRGNAGKEVSMESEIYEQIWKFKTKDRVISVFPLSMTHAASINGLKWISFMGNLLAMVSSQGLFRLIAVNLEIRDDFITVIEYQIPNGEAISSVQLFVQEEALLIFKGASFTRDRVDLLEEGGKKKSQAPSKIDELSQKQQLLKTSNYYKHNFNGVEICRSEQNHIEKLYFGNDLRISKVVKCMMVESLKDQNQQLTGVTRRVKFQEGVVSQHSEQRLVMCRNEGGFYIGQFNDQMW